MIFKMDKHVRGDCVITAKPYSVHLCFSTGEPISLIVEHERGYKAADDIPLKGDPKLAIRFLIDKIVTVMKSGVEFPSEDY